jgi:hypothetical protein
VNLQDYQNGQNEISYSVNPVNSENSGSDNGEFPQKIDKNTKNW